MCKSTGEIFIRLGVCLLSTDARHSFSVCCMYLLLNSRNPIEICSESFPVEQVFFPDPDSEHLPIVAMYQLSDHVRRQAGTFCGFLDGKHFICCFHGFSLSAGAPAVASL